MPEKKIVIFERSGPENTQATLKAARERAEELGIRQIVLATSSGQTALEAAETFSGVDVEIIAVTLSAARWEVYTAPHEKKIKEAEAKGVKFLTASHGFVGNIGTAIREKFGGLTPSEIIGRTYYTFSQGTKVAAEITLMAADAGLLDMEKELIAIGGTGGGADTALVIKPVYTTHFFDLNICEVICMPR
ncbi:MAG: hypothetical protein AMS15_01865 [Planctomycetes bacterium DG_23]|nr:MAG: hypothetical protein AMS15_01865 [Planctomycetes bacterium DG_23]